MAIPRQIVLGARSQSLGHHIAHFRGMDTAGPNGENHHWVMEHLYSGLAETAGNDFRVIVNTVGINGETPVDDPGSALDGLHQVNVNSTSHLSFIQEWVALTKNRFNPEFPGIYIAISSNSAHIARTGSAYYCASKAALSMGIRSMAREASRKELPHVITAIEPGYIEGTPMSDDVEERLPQGVPPHRIPSGRPVEKSTITALVSLIIHDPWSFHGCPIRLDGGEQ